MSKDICGAANIFDLDLSKIVIYTDRTNMTGIELGAILRRDYKIQLEVEAQGYIIAMSTIADTAQDLERLCSALLQIDQSLEPSENNQQYYKTAHINESDNRLPRDIYFGDQEDIVIEESIGKVSARNIMLYPPGIPLICIGEVFSKQIIAYIKSIPDQVLGIINEKHHIKVSIYKEGEDHEG